ncbi:MAG TPA: quercetin 2,3-dioxygenase [Solirubrobacterales bacterium]|nr:quercetin 2,3-dioxygenase [Solirubrobacterales bacterium]
MNAKTKPAHVAALGGEGEATWFLQNRMTVKAFAEDTGGAFGLVESRIAAGASPPLHVHRREDESFFVIEGEVRFRCGDEEFLAGPGSFVFLPRGVPHTFVVEGDRDAHVLTLMTPGGGERFFLDGGRPPEGPGLPPPGPPDVERMQRAAARYESEILGPPLRAGATGGR